MPLASCLPGEEPIRKCCPKLACSSPTTLHRRPKLRCHPSLTCLLSLFGRDCPTYVTLKGYVSPLPSEGGPLSVCHPKAICLPSIQRGGCNVIAPCSCEHKYQDSIHGKGMRVFTQGAKSATCTSCGSKRQITAEEKKAEGVEQKAEKRNKK